VFTCREIKNQEKLKKLFIVATDKDIYEYMSFLPVDLVFEVISYDTSLFCELFKLEKYLRNKMINYECYSKNIKIKVYDVPKVKYPILGHLILIFEKSFIRKSIKTIQYFNIFSGVKRIDTGGNPDMDISIIAKIFPNLTHLYSSVFEVDNIFKSISSSVDILNDLTFVIISMFFSFIDSLHTE
jgi:hypothetical protein